MKGIVLAGGSGTRLHPLTLNVSKQTLPIYDKPMIYYPISTLMLADIKNILIISTPSHLSLFSDLLGDGSQFGVNFEYKIQEKPGGIAEAFLVADSYIENEKTCLILGDNIFYGDNFSNKLKSARGNTGSTVFAYFVNDPERFGVVNFDDNLNALSIEEKPINPKSNYAVTGLYFYDENVLDYVKNLSPSDRGELEITDLNKIYLEKKQLKVELLDENFTWLDSGTHESLLESSNFVAETQNKKNEYIACLEEIAFKKNWITSEDVNKAALRYQKNTYGKYLASLI
tara:strand:+ start:1875 stop:2732 length:858 start_codon:yes stop_codon:yes gene_type:complete